MLQDARRLDSIAVARSASPITRGHVVQPVRTQLISRAAAVLRDLASEPTAGRRLVDVASALRLERPTAHRILQALVRERLADQDPASRRYRLGREIQQLALCRQTAPVEAALSEALKELARLTGDACFVSAHSESDAVCLARANGRFPVAGMVLEIGQRRPMGIGAGSVAMLAALPEDQAAHLIKCNEARLRARGELHGPQLMELLSATRERGYAVKPSAVLRFVTSVGVVVREQEGVPLRAISVSAATERIKGKESSIARMLREISVQSLSALR